jgi:hypothetical protein
LPRQKSILFAIAADIIRKAKTKAEKMARLVVRQARRARGMEKKRARMMPQLSLYRRAARRVRTAIVVVVGSNGGYSWVSHANVFLVQLSMLDRFSRSECPHHQQYVSLFTTAVVFWAVQNKLGRHEAQSSGSESIIQSWEPVLTSCR